LKGSTEKRLMGNKNSTKYDNDHIIKSVIDVIKLNVVRLKERGTANAEARLETDTATTEPEIILSWDSGAGYVQRSIGGFL
jgi:hypothetical protein